MHGMGYSDPWRLGVCLAGLAHHQMRDIASSWHTGFGERNIFDNVDDGIGEGERRGAIDVSSPRHRSLHRIHIPLTSRRCHGGTRVRK